MRGTTKMYLRNLRIVGEMLFVEEENTFKSVMKPAITGRIPYGSGELRSVNQKNPSVNIAGLMS